MKSLQTTWRWTALLLTLCIPLAAADETVEDVVEVVATGDQLIAVVDGRRFFREDLRIGESVRWQAARGEVGAILTSQRLLAVSARSGKWNIRPLKISEKQRAPEMLIADYLVAMLTEERILTFGTHTDGFFQTRLPIGEKVVASAAEGRSAAAVTESRAFGFSTYRRGAAEIRFRRGETFVSLKTAHSKVTLQTTERLITLNAEDAVWRAIDL